jgi:hypothetical protein
MMEKYLESSEFIDWQHPQIIEKSKQLAEGLTTDTDIAEQCFRFVRDDIKHSWDHQLNPVTIKASDVLEHQTGFCYAKSHLLAALLRANNIPAGLCYQRLTIADGVAPYCLHGLNAIYLQKVGWYRVDARGNKQGIMAKFCPPIQKLAFPVIHPGEADLAEIWPEPLAIIIDTLSHNNTYQLVADNLPDIELAHI